MQYMHMRISVWDIRGALYMSGIQSPTQACGCLCYSVAMISMKQIKEESVRSSKQRCMYMMKSS